MFVHPSKVGLCIDDRQPLLIGELLGTIPAFEALFVAKS
jgi:hypothetical protein